ncbi:type VI secretion protein [Acidocella aquatica]|uniref:Type VI secretion protein n=2 Tax=Acidocella aquatica TaxID=1922313 RepID=A0ABQ6A9S6_9PROT|nr:type VI secretion protein [Acidocella aquatica]
MMSNHDDNLHVRPGRIGHGRSGQPKSFVGEVMQAARKAGHTGRGFGQRRSTGSGSRFGRGRAASLAQSLRSPVRRVAIKARVVRHIGTKFRSAPLAQHVGYLEREGVTRDGVRGRMFHASAENADVKAFAERCEDDRHHFRFMVSPEDAGEMEDLRTFTRELMADAERDLGTRLDWVAVDHWNTDNPHIHVLVRGRADDGQDLVISRDYIGRSFRGRAEERVSLELGPRTEREISAALQKEVEAERWTGLDRALRDLADDSGSVADLRPAATGPDPELRRLLVGRAMKLERLGLAESVGPGCWALKPGIEQTLRDLSIRGDVIKTMHRAMATGDRAPDVTGFAIHGEDAADPVLGKLVERGLHDELQGSAYAIIEGTDGRTHHLRFANIDMTGDAHPGAIVELRAWEDAKGKRRLSLATRLDITLEAQVTATGATWLDRQLVASDPVPTAGGFGAEIRDAMARRADHLVGEGLARRQGERILFPRGLIETLRQRELAATVERLGAETGLTHAPSGVGDYVTGIYRQRVTLASGRFAMIDDGLGFQLVPWRPALEQKLGQHVSGTVLPGGGVDWSFGRQRGLGI